jgi:membrane protease YdiL (CAAX protease family)
VSYAPVNLPPPGWYADPGGQAGYRWWNGYSWTDQTSGGRQPPRRRIPARAAWWGLAGALVGLLLSGVMQGAASVLFPHSDAANLLLGEVGLWIGLGATCVLVSRAYGTGRLSEDFGLRFERSDIAVGIGASLLLLLVAGVIGGLFAHTGLQGSNTGIISKQDGDTVGVVIVALIAAVGAPIFEELFFRGFLRLSLASRIGGAAVWAQAALFGLAHYQVGVGWQNLSVIVAITGLGIVLGYVAERTGRLAAGMIAHGTFNLVVTLTIVLGPAGIIGWLR